MLELCQAVGWGGVCVCVWVGGGGEGGGQDIGATVSCLQGYNNREGDKIPYHMVSDCVGV